MKGESGIKELKLVLKDAMNCSTRGTKYRQKKWIQNLVRLRETILDSRSLVLVQVEPRRKRRRSTRKVRSMTRVKRLKRTPPARNSKPPRTRLTRRRVD